jgi:hypothetical protein
LACKGNTLLNQSNEKYLFLVNIEYPLLVITSRAVKKSEKNVLLGQSMKPFQIT